MFSRGAKRDFANCARRASALSALGAGLLTPPFRDRRSLLFSGSLRFPRGLPILTPLPRLIFYLVLQNRETYGRA